MYILFEFDLIWFDLIWFEIDIDIPTTNLNWFFITEGCQRTRRKGLRKLFILLQVYPTVPGPALSIQDCHVVSKLPIIISPNFNLSK
jgi:hypothetical protein